jgi:hypothetical protein
MSTGAIGKSLIVILFACIFSATCFGQRAPASRSDNGIIPKEYTGYIGMVKSAITDEIVSNTSLQTARKYGVESAGRVVLKLDVLIAPFVPSAEGFSTHVIYMVPGYGYVMRQVSVYPTERLAVFWLGYSSQGPGTDTGFNCTHSHSNCEIEDIPFADLRAAFRTWWLVAAKAEVGDPSVTRDARQRNAAREKLIARAMNADPQ